MSPLRDGREAIYIHGVLTDSLESSVPAELEAR